MRGTFEGWHIITLLILLGGFVAWLWALVDALRRPDRQWKVTGHSKVLFVVLIVILGWLGVLLYALIALPALRRRELSARPLTGGEPA